MSDNSSDEVAWVAAEAAARATSSYPDPFAARVSGRVKRQLGDLFGISSFGVNLTTLAPGSQSSLKHRHFVQDEFVYIVSGELLLAHDDGQTLLTHGMCAGFPHGGTAHHLINRSDTPATYLEIGDRQAGDHAEYPDDDLCAVRSERGWQFTHKNGDTY